MFARDSDIELGDIVWSGVAEHLAGIVGAASARSPSSFKFICEAIIATARSDRRGATSLNDALGRAIFDADCHMLCLRNPRHCSMFALPASFLRSPPPEAGGIASLFLRLHEQGATRANSYPQYRNIEMSYVAARLRGEQFFEPDALADFAVAFPWMTRDQRYGLTHVMLYNSDFGARSVEYTAGEVAIVEALIALADHDGDLDLMLELMLCHATIANAPEPRKRHYAALAGNRLGAWRKSPGFRNRAFGEIYHPLLVASLYSDVAPAPQPDETETRRHDLTSAVMAAFAEGKPVDALAAYADLETEFGPHRALDEAIDFYSPVLSDTLTRRAAAGRAHRRPATWNGAAGED